MSDDERAVRRRYPQAEARTAAEARLTGASGEWVIISGPGPLAAVIGRGDTREAAWATAALLARADEKIN